LRLSRWYFPLMSSSMNISLCYVRATLSTHQSASLQSQQTRMQCHFPFCAAGHVKFTALYTPVQSRCWRTATPRTGDVVWFSPEPLRRHCSAAVGWTGGWRLEGVAVSSEPHGLGDPARQARLKHSASPWLNVCTICGCLSFHVTSWEVRLG